MLNPPNVTFFVVWISLNQEINEDWFPINCIINGYNVYTFLGMGSRWCIPTMMVGLVYSAFSWLNYRMEFSVRASKSRLAVLKGTSAKKQTFKEPVFECWCQERETATGQCLDHILQETLHSVGITCHLRTQRLVCVRVNVWYRCTHVTTYCMKDLKTYIIIFIAECEVLLTIPLIQISDD